MKLIKESERDANGETYYSFFCPACQCKHYFTSPKWDFNGDLNSPTIYPSLLTGRKNFTEKRCHSFITSGKIRFLNDCHHSLKGKTYDLPDI